MLTSALWLAKAWAIAMIVTLVALALFARYTTWGRQFWRITGDYFRGRESVPVWALFGVLMLLVMIDVRSQCCSVIKPMTNSQHCRLRSRPRERRKKLPIAAFGGQS